eukprot:gene5788-5851_t
MRDGIRLATDVYLPQGAGPFPVVLERTPYGRRRPRDSERTLAEPEPWDGPTFAAWLTARGYACVFQDCRGRYESEGVFVKYLSEGEDGFDTCAWIMAQDWCDGRIVTTGMSYGAHHQAAMGCLNPPGLVAQVLDCGGFHNAWVSGVRIEGVMEMKQVAWAVRQAALSPEAASDPVMLAGLKSEDFGAWLTRLPWKPGHSPLRHHKAYEDDLFDVWRSGSFGLRWKQVGIYVAGYTDRYSQAACIHMSSWFDPYPYSATENYKALRPRGPQRLILGPWTHGDRSGRLSGDVDFGDAGPIDSWCGNWREYRLRYFNHVLAGGHDGEPNVRVFVMGGGSGRRTADGHLDHGGHWISAADWPLPSVHPTAFHLHGDGTLAEPAPAADAPPLSYDYDPSHPVPTIGGAFSSLEPIAYPGSFDQRERADVFGCTAPYLPLASRPDVLVFQTEPLESPVTLAGDIEIDLFVETDSPDTDFTVKLIDVHPPTEDYPAGYAMLLADGIVRLRYAEDPANPRLRAPGEITRLQRALLLTANLFLPGHRIRIDISSSNFPRFDPNPNTGEAEAQSPRRRIATNTLYTDAARPSRVILPILPAIDSTVSP